MASIKIDVIYYKTPGDFEFEFNISGCAGVRLFKEKTESPKALVTSLARDVSRSKIIIVVADLDNEDGGISTLAKAVGLPLVPADKEEYHIINDGDCNIFTGATPLVTKKGVFVGFVAESGPQSIIVLTSNRVLRHEIMDTYVHKYIFQVAQVDTYNKKYHTPAPMQDVSSSSQPPKEKEPKPEVTLIDLAPGTSITPPPAERIPDDEDYDDDNVFNERLPEKSNTLNIVLLVIVVLLLIGFGVLAYLFIYIPLLNGETPFLSDGLKYFLRR